MPHGSVEKDYIDSHSRGSWRKGGEKSPGIFRNKLFTHQAITVTLIYHTKKSYILFNATSIHESMCLKNLCMMYVFTVSNAARHPNLQRRSARHRTGDMAWISAMLEQITAAGRNEPHFPTRSRQSAGTLEVKNEFFKNCHGCIVFFMQWCEVILNDNVDGWNPAFTSLRPGSLSHHLQGFIIPS